MADLPTLLDTAEVARVLRCTPNAVARAVRAGTGPPLYGRGARGVLLFRADEVDAGLPWAAWCGW